MKCKQAQTRHARTNTPIAFNDKIKSLIRRNQIEIWKLIEIKKTHLFNSKLDWVKTGAHSLIRDAKAAHLHITWNKWALYFFFFKIVTFSGETLAAYYFHSCTCVLMWYYLFSCCALFLEKGWRYSNKLGKWVERKICQSSVIPAFSWPVQNANLNGKSG
jgi:hypothetical protein